MPFTLLRNGWYTENYTDQLGQYLQRGEILGAASSGRISAATRQDYAAAAVALLEDNDGNRTYELGGPAFALSELARVISQATGTALTYRDLPAEGYTSWLQDAGLDEASAHSWPPSTFRSPTATSRPKPKIGRGCWVAPPLPSPMSSARNEVPMSRDRCECRGGGKRL